MSEYTLGILPRLVTMFIPDPSAATILAVLSSMWQSDVPCTCVYPGSIRGNPIIPLFPTDLYGGPKGTSLFFYNSLYFPCVLQLFKETFWFFSSISTRVDFVIRRENTNYCRKITMSLLGHRRSGINPQRSYQVTVLSIPWRPSFQENPAANSYPPAHRNWWMHV